jgi:glutamate carboxypeptidase
MNLLLNYFYSRQNAILQNIETFVEIESPSFDCEGSRRAVDFLVERAEKLACVTSVERVATDCGEHLIVRAFESNEKPVLFLGHTDTVHPRGAKAKNPTRIEDGKLYGCGSFDMKANCVLIFEILRAFEELNLKPARPVTILLSCDEEVGSRTGRPFVESEAAKSAYCLVAEPSAKGKVKTGRKGTGNYVLKAHGIPSHAGLEPQRGASAILELARQIEKIHALTDFENGTTAFVCEIRGGTASNVVPAEAECSIDVRFTKLSEAEKIERAIKNLAPKDERVRLELLGEINRPPLERNEKTLALYERARRIAASFDYELGETEVGGASDGNFVAALGVPVLDGLGVSGDGAHTLEEYIYIEDIPRRATLLATMIL